MLGKPGVSLSIHAYLHMGVVCWHVETMAALVLGEVCGIVQRKENGENLCMLFFKRNSLHTQKHNFSKFGAFKLHRTFTVLCLVRCLMYSPLISFFD